MRKLLFTLILTPLLFVSQPAKKKYSKVETNQNKFSDSLTLDLKKAYAQDEIAGFSVAVINDKGILYENGFGYQDLKRKKGYTSVTTQNIGSISKTLIAIALMKAQELGKLNLDDPINKYLPFKITNPNHPEIPILVKHLAYHTSSINDLETIYGKSYVLKNEKQTPDEAVPTYFNSSDTFISMFSFMQNSLNSDGKWFSSAIFSKDKPGEKYEYSNIGAALCALIIESATGEDYQSFTRKYILKPLKMNNSGWSEKDSDPKLRSRLFENTDKMIAQYSLITYADGGFVTSSHDLGLYLSELMKGFKGKGILLSKESYQKIFEKHSYLVKEKTKDFGIFMEFRDKFLTVNDDLIGHNGSDPGVFTALYFNPKTNIGKIVLVNTDTDFSDKIWPEIISVWKSISHFEKKIPEKTPPK